MASLLVVSGPNEGEYHPLGKRAVVIGRDETNPIQIVDEHVSRKHLEIRYDERNDSFHGLDLGSANGTFLNDHRVTRQVPLTDGDVLKLGDSELMFSSIDFTDRKTAFAHYRRKGERKKSTIIR